MLGEYQEKPYAIPTAITIPKIILGMRFLNAPNARGKPRRSAKHGGHPQAELVGVGLTNLLGWCQMFGLAI